LDQAHSCAISKDGKIMYVMHEDAFQSAGGSNRPIRAIDLTNPNGYATIGGTGAGYAMMMVVDPNNADRLFFGNDWTISTASGCVHLC
jgi:hypothetical protein